MFKNNKQIALPYFCAIQVHRPAFPRRCSTQRTSGTDLRGAAAAESAPRTVRDHTHPGHGTHGPVHNPRIPGRACCAAAGVEVPEGLAERRQSRSG